MVKKKKNININYYIILINLYKIIYIKFKYFKK